MNNDAYKALPNDGEAVPITPVFYTGKDIKFAVAAAADQIRQQFGYQDRKEAGRLGTIFASRLSKSGRPGRRQSPSVSKAIRLLNGKELGHLPKSKRWPKIYLEVIPNWSRLQSEERKAHGDLLRNRASACLRKRRQRARKKET